MIGLGYDVQGNVRNKNGATYTFDFGNRLRASDAGPAVTYTYDGLGRRVRDSVSGQGNKYSLYSQSGQLVLVSDGHAKEVQDYVYLAGSLLAARIPDTTTNTYRTEYYHTDALGSPVVLTNANRQVVERKEYEPYGKLVSGSNDDRPGYTGHVMDNSSGLIYMQQRYYDPGIGMFLSVDPVTAYSNPVGQFHRYRYANNNPYRFTDPDGRCATTGSRLRMSEAGVKSRLAAIEKHEATRSYKTEGRAARAFANRALPVQNASGREIGANMERRGNHEIGLTDFEYGEKGHVVIPRYQGSPHAYVGTVHTHYGIYPAYLAFSGSGAYAERGKLHGVGPTDVGDIPEAYRRGGISIVVDPTGDLFRFEAAIWLRKAKENPGMKVYAGHSATELQEP